MFYMYIKLVAARKTAACRSIMILSSATTITLKTALFITEWMIAVLVAKYGSSF